MKVIKPLSQSLLHRTFEFDHRFHFTVSVFSFFDFDPRTGLLPENAMWPFAAQELGDGAVLDLGMPKPFGEVLVCGSFFAPGNTAVPAGRVRLSLGEIDKTLFVFGPRYWIRAAGVSLAISEPAPMTSLKIDFANAFGGPGFDRNPLGKGFAPVPSSSGERFHPLPNIEDPHNLIGSPKQRPEPACLTPLDMMWPQRRSKSGTYDQKWLEERFPGLPDDLDWSFYNTAPVDQQLEGFFEGNEPFELVNMHPEQSLLQGRLPGIRSRCFMNQLAGGETHFREIPLRADTVWLFPQARKGILTYRGVTDVATDDADDVSHLLLAYERLSDPSRPLEHYKEALEQRLDKDRGYLLALKESDLIPEGESSALKGIMDGDEAVKLTGKGLLAGNMKNRADREKDKLSEELRKAGLNPDAYDFTQAQSPAVDVDNLESLEDLVDQARMQRQEAEDKARKALAEQGFDYDHLTATPGRDPSAHFRFSAEDTISQLRELGVQDPEGETLLKRSEELLKAAYKDYGHFFPPCARLQAQELEALKGTVLKGYLSGESFAGKDLTGIDLSGQDLAGIDLRGAFLEGADLSGTNLEGADLSEAVLVRARMADTRLASAVMSAAGLGGAILTGANLEGAVLSGAILVKADLSRAILARANLEDADLSEASLQEADLSGTSLKRCRMMDTRLDGAGCPGANLSEALLLSASLRNCDFTRASLVSAILVKVTGDDTHLTGAELKNLRMLGECSFQDSNFSGARLTGANLRGANLDRCDFSSADISGSDFVQCSLREADMNLTTAAGTQFGKADLSHARMSGINLFQGSLQKALLEHTNLQQANLSCVDFMRVRFSNTDITQAYLAKSFIERWIPR